MTIEELLCEGKEKLHSDHAKILLANILNKNVLELYNYLDEEVSQDNQELYLKEVEALVNGKPLQYVLGNVNFYGNKFYVDERVLIPRFETEELVENTIKYANEMFNYPVDIIDLGCGSGVIGLTLEKKLNTNSIDLVDISTSALEVTTINKEQLNSNANLIESDMWDNITKKYDLVISNPPYIKTNEEIEQIVKENEPHTALFAGIDGLDCYKKIFSNIKPHLKDKYLIALEIGCTQANDIINIINTYLEDVSIEVKKDMSDKDRMIFIKKNV